MNSAQRKLPSFFVVGAQKAGTTTLHHWLSQESLICLPTIKETHFFSDPNRFGVGIDWYMDHFRTNRENSILGEVDPEYMFAEGTGERIFRYIPDAKFVFIFRHPIERAYSSYLMAVRRGYETLPFGEALLAESERIRNDKEGFSIMHHSYMLRGRYADQVERYIKTFSRENILYVRFEDLFNEKVAQMTYERVCRFIGMDSEPLRINSNTRRNAASRPRSKIIRDLLYSRSRVKALLRVFVPSQATRTKLAIIIDQLNQDPLENKQRWETIIPESIQVAAESEVYKLQDLTGLDLRTWLDRTN